MIEGIDVSTHQKFMNWSKALVAGARFAFIRAGSITRDSGVCYTDYQFERNSSLAPRYMPVGYYWFFRPNHSAERQARYFVDLIVNRERPLPAVCDIEVVGDASRVKQFCELVSSELGEQIMIYTSPNAWQNYLTGNKSWATDYPLWIAHWGVSSPTIPAPWTDYWVHQYAVISDGYEFGAESTRIDHDRAPDWLIGDPPAPPIPAPPGEGLKLRVIQEGLNVRTGPNTSYKRIGKLSAGSIIQPLNIGGVAGWIQFDYNGMKAWANVTWWGDRNMEPVE